MIDPTQAERTDRGYLFDRSILSVFVAIVLFWGAAASGRTVEFWGFGIAGVLALPSVRRYLSSRVDREMPDALRLAGVGVYAVLVGTVLLLMGSVAARSIEGTWRELGVWAVMVGFAYGFALAAVWIRRFGRKVMD